VETVFWCYVTCSCFMDVWTIFKLHTISALKMLLVFQSVGETMLILHFIRFSIAVISLV